MTSADTVAVVDLAPWARGDVHARRAIAHAVDDALRGLGFVMIVGHDIDGDLTRRLRAAGNEFFALSESVKQTYAAPALGTRGWVPVGAEANGYLFGEETPPDLKETWVVSTAGLPGRPESVPRNVWPEEVPELERCATALLEQMEALHLTLLEILGYALGLDDVDHLVVRSRCATNTFNLNWYPPLRHVGTVADGQYRIGPHTDFGSITLLDREPGMGGLQIQTADGSWVDAPFVPGAITVNVGDLLELWSGGRWRSSRHRVLPPPADAPEESLMSVIYFCEPDADTIIEPLVAGAGMFEPVRAGDWMAEKMQTISL